MRQANKNIMRSVILGGVPALLNVINFDDCAYLRTQIGRWAIIPTSTKNEWVVIKTKNTWQLFVSVRDTQAVRIFLWAGQLSVIIS